MQSLSNLNKGVEVTEAQKEQTELEVERRGRVLTEEDVKAIVDEFESRMAARFYQNLGRGIWGLVWNAFIIIAFALAGYGAWKDLHS